MKNKKTINRVLELIRPYTYLVVSILVLAAVTVAATLYSPILIGKGVDCMVEKGLVSFPDLKLVLIQLAVITAISAVSQWVMSLLTNKMTYKIVDDIRRSVFAHMEILPLRYMDAHQPGDAISRISTDVDQFSDGLLMGFTQLFSGIVTVVVTLIFMFSKNVWITLMVILLTPLSFLVAKFISSRSFTMFKKQSETRGKQTALIEEMIGNQKVVKAFGYEDKASKRFDEINKELKEYSQKAVFYSSLTNPSTRFVNNIIYAAVALAGAFLIPLGTLTVGGLSVLLSYANQYMKPFNDITSVITEMQNALACATRIFDLLEEPEEVNDSSEVLEKVDGNVDIDHVDFSYDKSKSLIEDFNLQVEPGMRIAIVGPTGCGKTTFINLLMRFYDVDSGKICIDGKPIDEISRHSLRKSFGMVLQDTWIKSGTVRENISFGKPDATDEEIIRAAKEAKSWDFIRRLPQGLDTVLHEDSISQGQKQLLCITRVMLCLPPMLILDEATSSIDTRTELQIQEAFERMMEGRTSFIVAHRLSTIRNADLILVMKDGSIIEQGTHDELIAKGGFYHTLYNSQFAKVSE